MERRATERNRVRTHGGVESGRIQRGEHGVKECGAEECGAEGYGADGYGAEGYGVVDRGEEERRGVETEQRREAPARGHLSCLLKPVSVCLSVCPAPKQ